MKGYADPDGETLSATERERLEARHRGFVEAAARLRGLIDPDVEPCWPTELEVQT